MTRKVVARSVRKGPPVDASRFFLDHFLSERLAVAAPATRESYLSGLHQWQYWIRHPVKLQEITLPMVVGFLAYIAETRSPASANKRRREILAILRYAIRSGYLAANWLERVPKWPETIDEPEVYTLDEIEALLAAARQTAGMIGETEARNWWPALILVLYDCGSRITATLRLCTQDCDLPRRTIYFRGRSAKTRRGRRYVISDQTTAAVAGIWCPHRELLFAWPYDLAQRQWPTLTKYFRKILNRAGLKQPKKPFHTFRATSGSMIEAAGGSGYQHLGHTSPRTFDAHYRSSRLCPDADADRLPRPQYQGNDPPMWWI